MADYYDAFWFHAAQSFGTGINYLLHPNRPLKVLDLCCGSGVLLDVFSEAGHQVTGIDISAAMLERARRRLGPRALAGQVQLIEGDVSSFQLDESFDLITCSFWSLHELPPHSLKQTLSAVARHLGPAGVFAAHVLTAGAARAMDGVVSIQNDAGGVATRIFLLTPEDDRLQMFHRGYGRTDEGAILPFTWRVAYHLHDWSAAFADLAELGLTHLRLLSVDAAREILELDPGGMTDQRDLVFLASRQPIDWGDRVRRLSERLRGARSRPGVL
jgi:SAM-dependent methyltransferase